MKYLRFTFALAAAAVFSAALLVPAYSRGQSSTGNPSSTAPKTKKSSANTATSQAAPNASQSSQDDERLLIVRDLDGEFAKAVQALPGGKDAFKIPADKPLDIQHLHDWVRTHGGPGANPGDTVQITKLEFQAKGILFEYNGGGKKKFHWRDHLSMGVGDVPDPTGQSHPGEGVGGTLILDFDRPLPAVSSDEIKNKLSALLDFSKQSATKNWLDTLPPDFKQGIEDHRAVVGMDEDMVLAALGHPERKVRSRDQQGNDTEDWIYGDPPARTVFVTFISGKVSKVEEFG